MCEPTHKTFLWAHTTETLLLTYKVTSIIGSPVVATDIRSDSYNSHIILYRTSVHRLYVITVTRRSVLSFGVGNFRIYVMISKGTHFVDFIKIRRFRRKIKFVFTGKILSFLRENTHKPYDIHKNTAKRVCITVK